MAFPSATLSFIVLLLATIQSRGDNVIINITDKRLAWSGPNRYHTKCGGVNSLMKNEVVLLNFTGTNIMINFMACNNSNSALISMDGSYAAKFDTYNSSGSICQLLAWPSHSLSQAPHNITVTSTDHLFIHSFIYTTTYSPTTSGHTGSKAAHIIGGTIGGTIGFVIIAAILFFLCRRRHRADLNTSIVEKLKIENKPSLTGPQVAIRNTDDPRRQLDDGTLPTIPMSSGFDDVLSLPTSAQAVNAPDVGPISQSNGDNIPRTTTSPSSELLSIDQYALETPMSSAVHNPSDDGCEEPVLPTGGEVLLRSRSSHASQMLGMTSNRDTEMLSTYTTEGYLTGCESTFQLETALVPSPMVQKLDEWAETSKVLFSIDIGTSFSAISFAYLQSQKEPVVENVSSWPGQVNNPTNAQTITAIYYDKNGKPRSYGARTRMTEIKEQAKKEGWVLAHSFQRHINNLSDVVSTTDLDTEGPTRLSLPDGVPIGTVYAHWIRYLFDHAESVFIAKYTRRRWEELKKNIEVVFTVPNGWYAQEHGVLARAAVEANIIQGPSQAKFVPETEAAIHWSLVSSGLSLDIYTNFLVCHTDTSTTNVALYHVSGKSPLQLQERKDFPSLCIEAGPDLVANAVVNDVARHLPLLVTSGDGIPDALCEGVINAVQTFGTLEENSVANETKELLPREIIAKHFHSEIEKIIAAIDKLKANNEPKFLLLSGDFSRNRYLQNLLRDKYKPDMQIINKEEQNIRSTAPGSILSLLQGVVVARTARFAIGTEVMVPYNHHNREHRERPVIDKADGKFVSNGWSQIVALGTLLADEQEYKQNYYTTYERPDESLESFETDLYTADEDVTNASWLFDPYECILPGFRKRCTIKANMSNLQGRLPFKVGPTGRRYYFLEFEVAIRLGATSPEARILWKEYGKVISSEATVVPVMLA